MKVVLVREEEELYIKKIPGKVDEKKESIYIIDKN
jgi:hypothetical protein